VFVLIVKQPNECWSKNVFDSQKETSSKWVTDHQLLPLPNGGVDEGPYEDLVRMFIIESNKKKDQVKSIFTQQMEDHFRLATEICGMKQPDSMGSLTMPIREGTHMAKSMANDSSDANVQRLCWTLYYSCNSVYKTIFGMEMNEYYEKRVMDQLNVSYFENNEKVGKGCVSQYINKLLNKYRCNVKDSMTRNNACTMSNVCTNSPLEWEPQPGQHKPRPKTPNCLFWVGRKSGMEIVTQKDATAKRKNKIEWTWVCI
jgi:hypothetical protein